MTFDYSGYELKFIQKQNCRDGSAHLFTLVYKFYSPVTKYFYIVHADYHEGDVFAIKFYCKKDRHSDYKYSKIVNKGDMGNVLGTCANAIPMLLQNYPFASFGFAGSRTVDTKSKKIEAYSSNQRYRIYKILIALKFGMKTFAHYEYEAISCYLLVNRNCVDASIKERELVKMFSDTYVNLLNVTYS